MRLPLRVFRNERDSSVKPRKTCKAATNEPGEYDRVEVCAEANDKCE